MTNTEEKPTLLEETVLAAKGAAQDMRKSASTILDHARTGASSSLQSAASSIRAAGNQGADAIEDIAERTGQRFESASSYIDSCDAGGVMRDLRKLVRRHPGSFLLLTAAVACSVGYLSAARNGNARA